MPNEDKNVNAHRADTPDAAGRKLQFNSVEEALRFGVSRHAAGAVAEATEVYRQLLPLAPDHPEVLRLYGLACTQSGKPTQGLAYLEKAIRLAPQHPLAHLHHGVALMALHRHREAVNAFRQSARLNHTDPAPRLNLSAALLELGRVDEALRLAQKVTEMAPQMAEGWNNVGLSLLKLSRTAPARAAFTKAVQLRPSFAEAWLNLGKAEKDLGRLQEAEVAYLTALKHQPDLVGAAVNLANVRLHLGRESEAEPLYRQVLEREPNHPEGNLGMAAILLEREQADAALPLIEKITPRPALYSVWLAQRANALDQLDRSDEARSLLAGEKGPAAEDMDVLAMRLVLALKSSDTAEADAIVDRVEARLQQPEGIIQDTRLRAHFGLGDYWRRRELYDRAFEHWRAGHELLRGSEPFSPAAYQAFTAALRGEFSAERLEKGPRSGVDDPTPVFIVGMPRSGTTLVEQVLDTHSMVHGGGELPNVARAFTALGGSEDSTGVARVAGADADALTKAARTLLGRLREHSAQAKHITDKMPHNFQFLGLIALLLPGARIIHCERDPRDVCLSIYQRRFTGRHAYAHRLEDLALAYEEQRKLMQHWHQVLPLPIHTVRYEALTANFESEVRAMLDFLQLPFESACLDFHTNTRRVHTASREQVRRPLYTSSVGRWRTFEPWLTPLIQRLDHDTAPRRDDANRPRPAGGGDGGAS